VLGKRVAHTIWPDAVEPAPVLRRTLVVVALAASISASTASAEAARSASRMPVESPGAFITRILKEEIHGEWSRQWRELHPGHRALITRPQYVACPRGMGTDFATGKDLSCTRRA
jgi:hypothetical protein